MKSNMDGWTLLNYTDREIYNNPTAVIAQVMEAIEKRKGGDAFAVES